MSLQLLAKQMEAKGRKGDSMLVHMTADEVAGLQKLAEAAGGSLSVNPETGLVEANFLKRMLPTLVGLGLAATGVGMPLAIAGGALTGGIQAKRNDQDVLAGAVMGGLGAYGGAGIAGGLGLGAAGAAGTAANTATAANAANTANVANTATTAATANPAAIMPPASSAPATQLTAAPSSSIAPNAANITLPNAAPVAPVTPVAPPPGGISSITGKQLMAASSPLLMPEQFKEDADEFKEDTETHDFSYDPNYTGGEGPTDSSERRWFNQRYTRMAEGGDVEAPSGLAALEARYGMSGASKDAYDYLMGRSASSSGRQMAAPTQATMTTPAPASASSDQEFIFNPATGTFSKNPSFAVAGATSSSNESRFPGFSTLYSPFGQDGLLLNSHEIDKAGGAAAGGLVGLAKGGMKSGGFVIPADVVSMVGEGNTDAGYSRIKSMVPGATAIKGKDGGQADTVKTSIEGKQPARVAHGEMYVPPETVKRMGGAKKLYAMMDKVRAQATGSKKQIKPVSLKRALA